MPSSGPVRLRPLRREDIPILHGWYQTPELWDHLVGEFVERPQAEATTYMARWLEPSDREVRFAIETEGRLVGLISLALLDRKGGHGELHIFLGAPDTRGQGLGRLATAAMVDHGFADLELRRISLRVLVTNVAARRVYEHCGFQVTAAPPESVVKRDGPAPVLVMEIDAEARARMREAQGAVRSATT